MIPETFLKRMAALLPEREYALFTKTMGESPYRGARVNTLKISVEDFLSLTDLPLSKGKFSKESFVVEDDRISLGKTPEHAAGLIYVQEPSASSAVEVLDPQPGEAILDLCASPGGKSTQIAARLQGKGFLWSNEYIKNRVMPLVSNIERMGIANAVISNAHPSALSFLGGCFDRVLVDAPCSGEGMFRKDPSAMEEWSEDQVILCARRQKTILDSAADFVRPGGVLVYSTCTFSPEENEKTVSDFLQRHEDYILDNAHSFGTFPKHVICNDGETRDITEKTVRIFPFDGGEGHFVCRMIRRGNSERCSVPVAKKQVLPREIAAMTEEFLKETFEIPFDSQRICLSGDQILYLPKECAGLPRYAIRSGVLIGRIAKNRIEPEHHLFMAFGSRCRRKVDFSKEEEIMAFLKRQEMPVDSSLKGWCAVLWNGYTVGFGKAVGGRLKNRYPKGLSLLG